MPYKANMEARREAKGIVYDEGTNLFFNTAGELCCSEYCTNRARIATIYVTRDEPDRGPVRKTSDGKYTTIGWGKCGVHSRGYVRPGTTVPAERITKDVEANADEALAVHDAAIKAREEREERNRQDYVDDLRRTAAMTRDQFTVEEDRRDRSMVKWVIYGPTGWKDEEGVPQRRAVSQVSVEADSGVYRVVNSDYSGHVGRGRGSTALTRLMCELMLKAADMADESNAEEA